MGLSSPLPASTNFGTSLRPGLLQPNELVPPGVVDLSPNSVLPNQASRSIAMCGISSLNSIPQTQASRPTITHFRSTSLPYSSVQNQVCRPITTPLTTPATNVSMPNGASHGRVLVRNRFQPPSVPRPVLGVCSHTIQKGRGNGGNSLRPQFLRPHMVSRGVGSVGNVLMANNTPHESSGFMNRVTLTQQHHNYGTPVGFSNYRNCNEPDNACRPTNISIYSQLSSQPASLSCVNRQTVASETQAYSQPLPLSNSSPGFHQTFIQVNNGAPSSHMTYLNNSQHGNEPQIRSQNGNVIRNTTQCGIASQATCQPQPHEQSPKEIAGKFSAFDPSWIDNTGQSILPTSGSVGQAPNVRESIEPLFECSQSPSSFVDFDNWFLDKDPFPGLPDGVLQSELNIPSPDLFPADMVPSSFFLCCCRCDSLTSLNAAVTVASSIPFAPIPATTVIVASHRRRYSVSSSVSLLSVRKIVESCVSVNLIVTPPLCVNLPRWFAAFWWRNGWKTGWRRGLVGKPSRNVEEPALRHRVSDEESDRTEPATGQTDPNPKPYVNQSAFPGS
ncbi:hypothetical protein ACSQ67_014745 [Phaseolus vulgaris]